MISRIERLVLSALIGLAVIATVGSFSPTVLAVTECPPGSTLVATEDALGDALGDPETSDNGGTNTPVVAGSVVCVTADIALTGPGETASVDNKSGGINIRVRNVTIVGRDVAPGVPPTITGAAGVAFIFRTDPGFDGVAIADLTLNSGNAATVTGIELQSNNNRVNNNTLTNGNGGFATAAIRVIASDDIIRGNTINSPAGDGIQLVAPSLRVTVQNNTINDPGDDGIDVGEGSDLNLIGGRGSSDGNVIKNAKDIGIFIDSSDNNVIQNIINNPGSHGIRVEDTADEDNVLDGNRIDSAGDDGINFNGDKTKAINNSVTRSDDDGINADGSNCVVDNNHVFSSGDAGGDHGIEVDDDNCQVTNNDVSGSFEDGIHLSQNNNTVTGNKVSSSGDDGIHLNGATADNNNVSTNTVDGSGDNGIQIDSHAESNTVDSNKVTNSTTDGIHIDGENNKVTNNTVGPTASPACSTIGNATVTGQGIDVNADNNTVTSNTVCNSADDGIEIDADFNTVSNNSVDNSFAVGIDLTGSADNNTVEGNTVKNSGQVGATGITPNVRLQCDANFNKVRSNTVSSTVNLGTSAVIVGIYVQGNTNTIGANAGEDSTSARAGGNTVTNPTPPNTGTLDVGIWLDSAGCTESDSASSNLVRNNKIDSMRLTGLRLSGGFTSDHNLIQHNKITGSTIAIRYTGGLSDVTDCNLIKGNGVGLRVEAGANAANLTVSGNQFKDNTTAGADNQGFSQLVAELNCWAKTGGGNCDPNPSGSGDKLFGNIDASPAATTACEEALTQSSGGNPAPPPANIIGDVNQDGKVDSNDVNLLDSYLKSLRRGFKGTPVSLTAQQLKNANVAKSCFDRSGNPIVNSRDLAKLKSFVNRGTGASDCHVNGSQKITIGQPAPSVGVSSEVSVTAASTRPADTIYVQLYDLTGKLVLERTAPGNRVELGNAPVTNGVYYYVATVRDEQGKVIARELHKLVIVR